MRGEEKVLRTLNIIKILKFNIIIYHISPDFVICKNDLRENIFFYNLVYAHMLIM
jgi:hypothetical protein